MNLATAIPQGKFTPTMAELYELMSDISEDCYCAGWMDGNEFRLWAAVTDPTDDRCYGQGLIDPNHIERMRRLSEEVGCWIVWGDDADGLKLEDWGAYFIPMSEWVARYTYAQTPHTVFPISEEPKA